MAKIEEQVSWNLSQKLSDQIDGLLRAGRRNARRGEDLECFFEFKELRLLINHHFSPDQVEQLDNFEEEINKLSIELKKSTIEKDDLEYQEDSFERKLKTKLITLKNSRYLTIEKYRKLILKLLDEYGYLMERKQDASYMM